ncbi:hypothetical protein ACOSQ4_012437 [Xanthoceras sorbifolium]
MDHSLWIRAINFSFGYYLSIAHPITLLEKRGERVSWGRGAVQRREKSGGCRGGEQCGGGRKAVAGYLRERRGEWL